MAVTKFLSPLFMLLDLALSILAKKWNVSTRKRWERDQCKCISMFKFSVLLSQAKSTHFGYELAGRWIRSRQANDMHFGHSLLGQMLLLLGGDIELNPGDRGPSCGICSKSVRRTESSMQCCECNGLFHLKCCEISSEHEQFIDSHHTWLCPHCNQSNFSWGFPKAKDNTVYTANRYHLLNFAGAVEANQCLHKTNATSGNQNTNKKRTQPKQAKLTCLLINCRSLKNKVADLASTINEYKPVFGERILAYARYWKLGDIPERL